MRTLIALACAVGACGAAGAAEMVLSPDGLGPLEIGISASHAERTLRQKIPPKPYGVGTCMTATAGNENWLGVTIVLDDRRVTRVDVEYYGGSEVPKSVRTAEGIGLGSSEEDVMKTYGARARVEPNESDPTWHYIYVDEPDRQRGIAFHTDGKKVKSMRGGEYPALAILHGCG